MQDKLCARDTLVHNRHEHIEKGNLGDSDPNAHCPAASVVGDFGHITFVSIEMPITHEEFPLSARIRLV